MVEESRKRTLSDKEEGEVEVERKKFSRGNEPLLKLLVPNVIAGVLIGKGGGFLNELKSKFGAYIRISGNQEYYPGTEERVVVITGKVPEVIDMNNYILEKIEGKGEKPPNGRGDSRGDRGDKVKIVVTNLSAGMLIGRGGASIKAIQEECGVKIAIADSTAAHVDGERILTMSGNLEQRCAGCQQVIEKISEEPGNMANTKTKYLDMGINVGLSDNRMNSSGNHQLNLSHDSRPGQQQRNSFSGIFGNMEKRDLGNRLFSALSGANSLSGLHSERGMGMGGGVPKKRSHKFKSNVEVKLEIPDIMVGTLMGKNGQSIKDFVHRSGARFSFSNKDEFVEGTTDRTLTIKGNMDQVRIAYDLVHDKAEEFQPHGNQ